MNHTTEPSMQASEAVDIYARRLTAAVAQVLTRMP